jgi:formylglycine-generating enzyme required for sulfatase activity
MRGEELNDDRQEELQDEQDAARWRVDRFVRQFGEGYRGLVRLAAVPIVLTPELVGYLRGQFLPGLVWVAEADLLLSELCRPVGYERYVMDGAVQAIALKELEELEPLRVEEVARLLVGYMRYLARVNPYLTVRQRKHQQWAAMLCVAELRGEAIGQIAAEVEYWEGAIAESGIVGVGRSEMVFLEQVLREQMPRLLENSEYVRLARRVSAAVERMNSPIKVDDRLLVSDAIAVEQLSEEFAGFPPLQKFEFETVEIVDEVLVPEEDVPVLAWRNHQFKFKTARLVLAEPKRSWLPFQAKKTDPELVITKGTGQAEGYIEQIDSAVSLKMIAIPAGRFQMGAREDELEARSNEQPQHWVTVPEFWLGQGPVSQEQWMAVAGFPQVKIEMKANPSSFKGSNLPVETVSWDEAVEFCDRLSALTGRTYRLPSEAMWEYACRAGTTTPFSSGETIDAELANYSSSSTYGKGKSAKSPGKTTPIGQFPANDFGLHDMHGNVWEWCEDHWHGDYKGAPIDGSSWLKKDSNPSTARVRRGGSWVNAPGRCRSACRSYLDAGTRNDIIGFRVCVVDCVVPRALR